MARKGNLEQYVRWFGNNLVGLTDSLVWTLKTSQFTLRDATDPTKQLTFDLSKITTGTTKTLLWPNVTIVSFVAFPFATITATSVWTNMPLAQTEMYGSTVQRKRIDLSGMTDVRLHAEMATAGSTNAILDLQYSTNIGTPSWTDMDIDTPIGTTTGWRTSGWVSVPSGAKTDVLLRLVGQSGDGAADPNFQNVYAEFR